MKLLIRYLTVLGIAIIMAALIINYQQNTAKNTDQTIARYTTPLLNRRINAVVIDKSIVDPAARIQSGNAMLYSLSIAYVDIESRQASSFLMNYRYGKAIDLGDTITKNIGDKAFITHKKRGLVIMIPVE